MTDLGRVVTFRSQLRHTSHNEHHGYLTVTELCQPSSLKTLVPIDRPCPILFIRLSTLAALTLTTLHKIGTDVEPDRLNLNNSGNPGQSENLILHQRFCSAEFAEFLRNSMEGRGPEDVGPGRAAASPRMSSEYNPSRIGASAAGVAYAQEKAVRTKGCSPLRSDQDKICQDKI
jgi:hypothetical protein